MNDFALTNLSKLLQCQLIEIPITTVNLSLKSDTIPNVKRYVSASYKSEIFSAIIKSNKDINPLIMCSHPYELFNNRNTQSINYALSFDINQFKINIKTLIDNNYILTTIQEIYETFKRRS